MRLIRFNPFTCFKLLYSNYTKELDYTTKPGCYLDLQVEGCSVIQFHWKYILNFFEFIILSAAADDDYDDDDDVDDNDDDSATTSTKSRAYYPPCKLEATPYSVCVATILKVIWWGDI